MTVSASTSLGVGLMAVALVAYAALGGDDPSLPDPQLTPGAVASSDPAVVCVPGYARSHRVWHDKAGTLRRYGISPSRAREFEDDDRLPICAGGDNADPRNHWPQSCAQWDRDRCIAGEAADKDRLEAVICREVCDRHTLSLPDAQAIFLGDWRKELWRIGE